MTDTFQYYTFNFPDVAPTLDELLVFMHVTDADADDPVKISSRELLDKLQSHKTISGGYIVKPITSIEKKEGIIMVDNRVFNTGRQISAYINGATHAALFVCTAGSIFSELSTKFNKENNYLEAYIADSIGSLTVEKAMDHIQQDLKTQIAPNGLSISNRYSPGYCNWPLSGQKELFELIGNNPTNILLTDSCLMNPIKSVSGIIGIGTTLKERPYGCAICANAACIYRKIIH